MTSRTLFPELNLIKKSIVERFLIATMEIYKRHPTYPYIESLEGEEQEESKIIIIPSYGDDVWEGKKPKIVAKAGGYNFHLMDTLNRNMSREYVNPQGIVSGQIKEQIISSSLSITVQAYAEEESSDLADELASLMVFACYNMYAQVGLLIRSAQVSATEMVQREQKVYQTNIMVTVDVPWSMKAAIQDPPVTDVEIDPIVDEGETFGYRAPGVTVQQKKE